MNNFIFKSPTEIVFGKETEKQVAPLLKKYGASKVMVHYGKNSVIKSGLLDAVLEDLKKISIDYVTLGGVQANPIDTLVYEGIALCRSEQVDFILAIGGGSVIDSAKAISFGYYGKDDFWKVFDGQDEIKKALPIGCILTIPAAGSEVSGNTVITKTEGLLKRGIGSPLLKPQFSILNPELTYRLPDFQTACGIADMLAHIIERYFSNDNRAEVSEHLSEALMKTIVHQSYRVFENPMNYEARANLMWSGSLAHNGLCGLGRQEDWSSHALEHELSAQYDVAHGAGLAVMIPAWMTYVYKDNLRPFVTMGREVFNLMGEDECQLAEETIQTLKGFFRHIGLPTNFKELGAKKEDIPILLERLLKNKGETFGSFKQLTLEDARKIYELAAE